jgi:hypothetical protein
VRVGRSAAARNPVRDACHFKEPAMNFLRKTLATLCLAATTLAAQAVDLTVSIAANFNLPPLSAGPGTLTMSFTVSDPVSGAIPESEFGFKLADLSVAATFNSSSITSTANQIAWFAYTDSNYFGIDLRLRNMLVPGDVLQMIIPTFDALYTGTAAAPTLEKLNLGNLSGGIYYYPSGLGGATSEGLLSNVSYDVSAVPEPAAAWLLPVGLMLIAGLQRRRLRSPVSR